MVASYPISGDRTVPPSDPLQLMFDQPMDAARVEAALVISPSVAGQFTWPAPDRLVFRPTAWAEGTEYTATLGPEARSAAGGALASAFALRWATGGRGAPLPVLMYHRLITVPVDAGPQTIEWTTAPDTFRAQMDYLAGHGYHTVSLDELVAYLEEGRPLPPRPVALTFDDGWVDVYDVARPVLKAHGFTGTAFIVTSYVGRGAFMSWQQLAELKTDGWSIGSHTVSHDDLAKMTLDEATAQLRDSKAALDEHLGLTVTALSYPYGAYSADVAALLPGLGYRSAYTINPSVWQRRGAPYRLSRVHAPYNFTLEQFVGLLPDPCEGSG